MSVVLTSRFSPPNPAVHLPGACGALPSTSAPELSSPAPGLHPLRTTSSFWRIHVVQAPLALCPASRASALLRNAKRARPKHLRQHSWHGYRCQRSGRFRRLCHRHQHQHRHCTPPNHRRRGYFIFPQLAIGGPYTVKIEKAGLPEFPVHRQWLNINENRDVDAKLKTGSVSQTIQVNANAVQVDTSDTQLKTTVPPSRLSSCRCSAATPPSCRSLRPAPSSPPTASATTPPTAIRPR